MDFETEYEIYINDKRYVFPRTISVYDAIGIVEKQKTKTKYPHKFDKNRTCSICGIQEKKAKLENKGCK